MAVDILNMLYRLPRVYTTGNWQQVHLYRSGRYKHGHNSASYQSPTYTSWRAMRQRCSNPTNARWAYYGGKGITVCERWNTFANFLKDMGERPKGTTSGRIHDQGNYEPGNCKWVTSAQQSRSKMRSRAILFERDFIALFEAGSARQITDAERDAAIYNLIRRISL